MSILFDALKSYFYAVWFLFKLFIAGGGQFLDLPDWSDIFFGLQRGIPEALKIFIQNDNNIVDM